MSEVRRAEDIRLRRPVAIKLLAHEGDRRAVARFEQEAQILARLHHQNVVIVFDAGVDGDDRFIVMELVEGPTLRELLDEEGSVGPERAAEVASAVASALEFAHDHDVVHRDVKPANVLLPRGGVKLADMGIATLLSPDALTMTLSALGTARYTSPEQALGEPVDGRSDLYSLGCVLFEMLTGRTPFEGDLAALSYAHAHTPAPRVRSIDAAIPAAIDELVAAMLEKDPAYRPQTGADVRISLAAAIAQDATAQTAPVQPAPPQPAPQPQPPPQPSEHARRRSGRRTRPTAALALGGLVVLTVLIALLANAGSNGAGTAPGASRDRGSSPATQQPSPTAGAETTSPPASPPATIEPDDPLTPEAAAQQVLGVVSAEVEAGGITGHIDMEIRKEIREILREIDKGEDPQKSFEKIDDLREKVTEAFEKEEITSAARAAIDEALVRFAEALGRAGQ